MKKLILTVLSWLLAASCALSRAEFVLPDPAVYKVDASGNPIDWVEFLKTYALPNVVAGQDLVWGDGSSPNRMLLPDPEAWKYQGADKKPLDWEFYVRNYVFPNMGKTGGGRPHHTVGTVVFRGRYGLMRTLRPGPFHFLAGEWRPGWHLGNSCGVFLTKDFQGEVLIEWEMTGPDQFYNAFGSGCGDFFVLCEVKLDTGALLRKSGMKITAAQQRSLVNNVGIRGFGPGNYGLSVSGDTFRIVDVFIDRDSGGAQKMPSYEEMSVGLTTWGGQLSSVSVDNLTVHSCSVGVLLGNTRASHFHKMEVETCHTPIEVNYNCEDVEFTKLMLQHGDRIAFVSRQNLHTFELRLQGMMRKNGSVVDLPGGKQYWVRSADQSFDLSIGRAREKDKAGRWVVFPSVRDLADEDRAVRKKIE